MRVASVSRFLLALAVAVVVHAGGIEVWPAFSRAVDVFLVLALFGALGGNLLAGLFGGMVAGLVMDALTGPRLYGLHGLANTVVGYGTAWASQRLVIQRASGVMLIFALAAAVQQALLLGLLIALLPSPEVPTSPWLLAKVGSTSLLGWAFFLGRGELRRRSERWRRSRTGKLRFGG